MFSKEQSCEAFQNEKQVKTSFKEIPTAPFCTVLQLLHIDLFGLVTPVSFSGGNYTLVVVDNYSKFTYKKESETNLHKMLKKFQNEKSINIV